MKTVGTPVRLFYNDQAMKFLDVTGTEIQVPARTLWLESEVTDTRAIQEIDEKQLVAYSITVSEKSDAETVMNIYNKISTKTANKENIDTEQIKRIHEQISSKRTLIKDIKDPVMLTVSLVKFPCVNKAKFCQRSLNPINNDIGEKMEETKDNANKSFMDGLQELVNKYLKAEKEDDTQSSDIDADIESILDTKLEAMKTENKDEIQKLKEEILASIKATLQDNGTPNGVGYVYEEVDTEGNLVEPVGDAEPYKDEENVETADKEETVETEEETPEEEETTEVEETPEEETTTDEEEETEPAEKSINGRGGKTRKQEIPLKQAEPSAQKSRTNAKIDEGGATKMIQLRNEDDVIYDAIKNGLSTKSINLDEVDLTGTGLNSTYDNEVFLALLNNEYATNVYKASFSESNTNKAILTTAVFSSFVSKLIQSEPIFEDAQYQTGHHGKGYIYDLGLGTYDTEDGHLSENFYFDSDPDDDAFDIDAREVRCYTQRRKVTISDRQRLANVFGDDLVNKVLEISRKKLFRGVYAARVWSDTTLDSSVDIQYRRQDGLLKQAGQQVESGTDFDTTKASDIFEAMYYALPEEAQVPSDYVFYVPSNVHRAYNKERYANASDAYYEQMSTNIPLAWNDIPIKVSPALNRADMKTLAYGGDSAVLLTAPDNTNLFVGREAGIELKRNADTSSDTFYETIDTGVAYTIPGYAVCATIDSDDYDALITAPETTEGEGSP